MEPMVKWIGGATAALVLLLGGATLASGLVTGDNSQDAPALEEAIPAEETVQADEIAQKQGIATTAEPAVQQVAQDTDDTFVIKRILPISGPIKYGEWHWDDEGVPDGPLVMTVDLDARVLSVFRGGYEIGASAVLLGTDEHPTPLGTFPIRYKMRHNVSEKYNNAPMPYSMFLTTDGVAIHGSQVENGYASHGCIGTPDDFAAKVFAIAKKGDKVIITRGKRIGMGDSII
ncbi:L,D-transpeptidase family protein [Altererythrobacter luteolus]|uniref:L,D-transpeptidase family protein n=1 Tax=Pontixanthobacter luteolus TaxID=295089 RepID=A0A6I4V0Y8_9SPHN|nr:L,D-transpeptidase family protein [Pontixanthobacter luteolus]MXP47365.1 L,D-transpeptidase family protein [Pontixanthobacter luteolus]